MFTFSSILITLIWQSYCVQQNVIHIIAKSLGPLRGPILPWVHMRNLGLLSKMKEGKDPGDEFWYEIRERKQQGETPNL